MALRRWSTKPQRRWMMAQRGGRGSCRCTSRSGRSRCWRCLLPCPVRGAGAPGIVCPFWARDFYGGKGRRWRGVSSWAPSLRRAARWKKLWTEGPGQNPSPGRCYQSAAAFAGSSLRGSEKGVPLAACPSHAQGGQGVGRGWEQGQGDEQGKRWVVQGRGGRGPQRAHLRLRHGGLS